MNILVIGSKGFIGSHVYRYFSSFPEHDCRGCDVVVDYNDPHYYLIDSVTTDFHSIFEARKFDVCINCSGAASVPESLKNPLRDFSLNVFILCKILDSIRTLTPSCRLLTLSSAAVYGDPKRLPIMETDECRPLSPYGRNKLFAEDLCKEYFRHYQVRSCSLRIFSAYGPGLRKQLLWDVFQKSKDKGGVKLFGTGNETRDFIFISDIVHAMEIVIQRAKFEAEVYNVANGTEISVGQVATEVLGTLNYNGTIQYTSSNREGDPIHWKANISLLSSLGFVPKIDIKAGIKKYVEWLREEKLL